jgi:hypothetical protein
MIGWLGAWFGWVHVFSLSQGKLLRFKERNLILYDSLLYGEAADLISLEEG